MTNLVPGLNSVGCMVGITGGYICFLLPRDLGGKDKVQICLHTFSFFQLFGFCDICFDDPSIQTPRLSSLYSL